MSNQDCTFVVVSSVFPGALKFGEVQADFFTNKNSESIFWVNPGLGEKLLNSLALPTEHFFTPSNCPMSDKHAEAFLRSLEDVNSYPAFDHKAMWAHEFASKVIENSQEQVWAEKALLNEFSASADGSISPADSAAAEAKILSAEAAKALDKAQKFLIMTFFLEKTQCEIKAIFKNLSEYRNKMDSSLGFLENMALSDDPAIREEAKQGLDELRVLAENLPDAQDFYDFNAHNGGASSLETSKKPDWKLLLSSVVAFAPEKAVFISQNLDFEQDLKEKNLWDQFLISKESFKQSFGGDSLDAFNLGAGSFSILKLSLAEIFNLQPIDVARPWLHTKRVFIMLSDS